MELKTLQNTHPWEWPEDASETLLEVLTDERADDSDRILAAELAGDYVVINEELANALLSIMQNGQESELLRVKAAISLGPVLEHADTVGFEDSADALITESTFRRIKKLLLKLFLDTDVPKELRRPIFEASVRAPQEWHQDAIQAAYTGADEDWRLTAVFAMRWVRGFEDQILEALDSENQEVALPGSLHGGQLGAGCGLAPRIGARYCGGYGQIPAAGHLVFNPPSIMEGCFGSIRRTLASIA